MVHVPILQSECGYGGHGDGDGDGDQWSTQHAKEEGGREGGSGGGGGGERGDQDTGGSDWSWTTKCSWSAVSKGFNGEIK